ncbi:ribonuclease R [Parasphingopyxis lamellibrachiae]|uniref:Ribonuclease R n=1 Tax=Parasphingopyxis lamellibrachiae TaxID=680125 RepID=A0A3D9FBK3_9SPHN|nr:ribonuclease R [Parasphingopyxis lamellibrachiae]RED15209.1 RNAse R [Parasphingopyxis lamellibrachiae]
MHGNYPTDQQILDFIQSSDRPAGKREIARAFGLKGQDKIRLKATLKRMADKGLIDRGAGKSVHKADGLPRVTVLRIVSVDDDGDIWAEPERWGSDAPVPRVRVKEQGKRHPLGIGDRVLARTEEAGKGWIAHPMKKIAPSADQLTGVIHEEGGKLWLKGLEKSSRRDFLVVDANRAKAGDLVMAEKSGRPPRISARVTEILGDPFEPRSFSLIAIHKHEIPVEFAAETLAEADRVVTLPLGEREDLTHLPIVAIDPADARDHDDAFWAEPDGEGGWKVIVAIADVSYYVRPGSSLDRDARKRGNSVYFPDRVVPMLPETLSADICSLRAGEDRAALACHLAIDKAGQVKSWRFARVKLRIAANIAYEDAQAAMDAQNEECVELSSSPCSLDPADLAGPDLSPELVEKTLKPLWDCWRALSKAREKRAPLDLDLPERRIELDETGRILSVAPRERLDAHKLVEEYMIAANVAAAKALEAKTAPVMYRVHETPSREKLVALKEYLASLEVPFTLGQVITPETFNHILDRIGEADIRPQVMEQILRSQTQAYYTPRNMGHFGLALGSYAHFTSPIRRYSDLIVHRSLVGAYGLGPDVAETRLTKMDAGRLEATGETISKLERRAMEAERDTVDRYVAAYLAERVGQIMPVRITGVQNFGFFATVEGFGGDGILPVRDLGREYYRYDERVHALIGEETGTRYALGDRLELRLVEANPVSGGLRFELPEGKGGGTSGTAKRTRGHRGQRDGRRTKRRKKREN